MEILFSEEELQEDISAEKKEYDLTNLFERLAKSDFRSHFHLSRKDWEYVMEKGLPTIRKHAEDFVAKRLLQKESVQLTRVAPILL